MSDQEVLVRCSNASKKFCRDLKKSLWYGVKDSLADIFRRSSPAQKNPTTALAANDAMLRSGEFWANKDISFELKRGECLGLIGRNGAGKTTLLKMLNGLVKPDAGRIELKGHVGALIALGAGFNPVLTGRENIFVNGAVLGLSRRRINDLLEEIVEFASLAEFIDTPVRAYSSGMQVRLGFSIATTLSPDVLLVDEVLAVGDAGFRAKCFSRITQLLDQAAVILVSHNMNAIANICTRAIVMDRGQSRHDGDIDVCIRCYDRLNESEASGGFTKLTDPITGLSLSLDEAVINTGDSLDAQICITCSSEIADAVVRIVLYNESGTQVAELGSGYLGQPISLVAGQNKISVKSSPVHLKGGSYRASLCVGKGSALGIIGWDHLNTIVTVVGPYAGFAAYQMDGSFCQT